MKDWLMEHKFYVVAVVVIVFGSYYFIYLKDDPLDVSSITQIDNQLPLGEKETEKNNQGKQTELPEKIMVDVKGQIKLPGVYLSSHGERVIDVINRAGGLTDKADQSKVNFAEHVQDAMVIYIPAKGEEGFSLPGPSSGTTSSAIGGGSQNQERININTADENELQKLPGIGPAKASAIVEYRKTSGPFTAVEDIKKISGIGEKTFEKLKDLIIVR